MNTMILRLFAAVLLCLLAASAGAQTPSNPLPSDLTDPEQRERYKSLLGELRCTVCQNQSLADSNAGLALDLRRQVYNMVTEGASEQEVVNFMVERYGEFVLYRPPMKPATYALWLAPFVLLAFATVVLLVVLRKRSVAAPLSEEERKRLERLIETSGGGERS